MKLYLDQSKVLFCGIVYLCFHGVFSHYAWALAIEHTPIEIKGHNPDIEDFISCIASCVAYGLDWSSVLMMKLKGSSYQFMHFKLQTVT